MNDRRLTELLRRAEGMPSGEPAIEGGAVRRIVMRRRARRRGAGVALVVVVCGGIMGAILLRDRSGGGRVPINAVMSGSGGSNVQKAEAISVEDRIAMEAQVRLDRRRVVPQARGSVVDMAEARDEAARIMVMVAARRGELAGKQEAAELYVRAIAMFPETSAAQSARALLAQLERNN